MEVNAYWRNIAYLIFMQFVLQIFLHETLLHTSNLTVKTFKLEQTGIITYKCSTIMMKHFVKLKISSFKHNMIITNENKISIVQNWDR